ncbi:MAG TPA: radical SAM protein [Candidatus Sulfotelmatobacter sp.]|nr:radical SAM protein [Candidatus Sulfotelmatobacter sp.]HWI58108.1 radical SAM protein [Bacillota bacterium]
MIGIEPAPPGAPASLPRVPGPNRHVLAAERAALAQAMLGCCHLCAHHCGANRLAGPAGPCHAGPEPRFFSAQVEVADELELIPTFAVALSGCDLRCDFCLTGQSSWNPKAGQVWDAAGMAAQAARALEQGARTVMLLGGEPTIHLPAALAFVAAMPVTAKLVWKTNAHCSVQARQWLDGLFDVWVADFKFGNNACAQRLARIADYVPLLQDNLRWAWHHTGLIVRHLLLPGHGECCWRPIAEWLAAELPAVKVSLRSGFWPAWHAARHPELRQTIPGAESERALQLAHALGLNLVP